MAGFQAPLFTAPSSLPLKSLRHKEANSPEILTPHSKPYPLQGPVPGSDMPGPHEQDTQPHSTACDQTPASPAQLMNRTFLSM